MAAIAGKAKAPSADVLAAARPIVRALTPAGRTNRRESEDELRHRFAEDGAEIDKKYFNAALAVLEENGHAGGCDAGRLPGCRTGLSGPSPSCLRRGVIPGRSVGGVGGFTALLMIFRTFSSSLSGGSGRARTPGSNGQEASEAFARRSMSERGW
jgi:hypothetical protein